LLVPNLTVKLVAPLALHVNAVFSPMDAAPFAGFGDPGVLGGGGAATVVNDQTGPAVVPALL
jgi:hypothetical protein